MIKLPDAKETKFVYPGGNGAFECGYESGWNAAITEVHRLNATAQPKCQKCGDTGMADSGGTQPWGEQILIECDCATAQPVSDGWVKCSERMPDSNEVRCLVFCRDGVTRTGFTSHGDWAMNGKYYDASFVTHWMPLPAAPGGQD